MRVRVVSNLQINILLINLWPSIIIWLAISFWLFLKTKVVERTSLGWPWRIIVQELLRIEEYVYWLGV